MDVIAHFEGVVMGELDLRLEASAASEFAANTARDDGFSVLPCTGTVGAAGDDDCLGRGAGHWPIPAPSARPAMIARRWPPACCSCF